MRRLLLIHGLGQTPSSWDATLHYLNDAGQARCIDLTAAGGRDALTYEHLYTALCRRCSDWEGPADLCGLSLGGVLALHYATEHPEKVRSLALINAQYKMPTLLLKMQSAVFHLIPDRKFPAMGFSKRDILSLTKSMEKLSFEQSLARVACPALVLYGQKDRVNQKAAVDLSRRLKQSKLEMIADAGHEINIEQPQKLAEALNGFYASINHPNGQ